MLGCHMNFHLSSCGLFTNPRFPYLGASPDGVITCDCCGTGVIEIKCPYVARGKSPFDATLNGSIDCLEIINGQCNLKHNHSYYYQVQAQLHLCEVSFSDFIVWTTRGLHVERIFPDVVFFNEVVARIARFYKSAILPELLGSGLLQKVSYLIILLMISPLLTLNVSHHLKTELHKYKTLQLMITLLQASALLKEVHKHYILKLYKILCGVTVDNQKVIMI
jgi:hypothetical protein